MDKIRVGYVGLGGRGHGLLQMILRGFDDVIIAGVCDEYQDRVESGAKLVKQKRGYTPVQTLNYKDFLDKSKYDLIFIATAWEDHIKIAIDAMNAGIFTTMEVGGAYSLKDCHDLVDTYEKTRVPVMMLENCCYGEDELRVMNMVREGLFGKVVHCAGGYLHDLRSEICNGDKNRHYRLRNYASRNCENYPTHEIGPIAKILDINRGNKFTSLYSISSNAEGLKEYASTHNVSEEVKKTDFKQGDIVTTSITCENGETVVLTLDTTLPRFYSRGFTVKGTKMMFQEDGYIMVREGHMKPINEFIQKTNWNSAKKYKKYNHELWKKTGKTAKKYGHGGMDYFVMRACFDACKNGTYPPIDVYDIAAWMAITPLSEISINEKKVVDFPDFTKGAYKNRPANEKATDIFNLDK